MNDILSFIALIALFNNAIFVLLEKFGAVTFYQLRRPTWLPENCNFCLFFWLAFLELLAVFLPLNCTIYTVAHVFIMGLCTSILSLFFKRRF